MVLPRTRACITGSSSGAIALVEKDLLTPLASAVTFSIFRDYESARHRLWTGQRHQSRATRGRNADLRRRYHRQSNKTDGGRGGS